MAPKLPPIKKIAVAIAGKSANPQVVHHAARMAEQLGAKLVAVHIRYPGAGKPTFMMDALPVFTEDDVREHIRRRGYKELADAIPVRIFEGSNPAKLLARVTRSVDMLIIGQKNRNRILQALSTAPLPKQIMDVVECPVLVIPPKRRAKKA